MKLSILIPCLPEPRSQDYLNRLMNILVPQVDRYKEFVEIDIHDAGRHMPTGTKRNEMIRNCDGEYFSFIDCDDTVPNYYVESIMRAIELNPDVITFNGYMTTAGVSRVDFIIKLGEKYEERDGKYYRFPNHLCAFKKDKVKHVRFPPLWHGEDYIWAKQINDMKLLKTEVHIDKEMYHYDFRPQQYNTQQLVRKRRR